MLVFYGFASEFCLFVFAVLLFPEAMSNWMGRHLCCMLDSGIVFNQNQSCRRSEWVTCLILFLNCLFSWWLIKSLV